MPIKFYMFKERMWIAGPIMYHLHVKRMWIAGPIMYHLHVFLKDMSSAGCEAWLLLLMHVSGG